MSSQPEPSGGPNRSSSRRSFLRAALAASAGLVAAAASSYLGGTRGSTASAQRSDSVTEVEISGSSGEPLNYLIESKGAIYPQDPDA